MSRANLQEHVDLVARSSLPILITGEKGVGKEVVATDIHARSARQGGPFVAINCAARPEAFLESDLFGYGRGPGRGATHARPGLLELAEGGTLFLDEIGEMPLGTQAKLLDVLESDEPSRPGGVSGGGPRWSADVRFVASTIHDLPDLVAGGEFRRDLYFRLNGMTIHVAPLRERLREIESLTAHFVALGARRANRRAPSVPREVLSVLRAHAWPGNVRELRSVVDRAVAICDADALRVEHLVFDMSTAGVAPSGAWTVHGPRIAMGRAKRRTPAAG
jgi:two-component system response regulator AtoC